MNSITLLKSTGRDVKKIGTLSKGRKNKEKDLFFFAPFYLPFNRDLGKGGLPRTVFSPFKILRKLGFLAGEKNDQGSSQNDVTQYFQTL